MRRRLHLALLTASGLLWFASRLAFRIEREHLDYRDNTHDCYHRP